MWARPVVKQHGVTKPPINDVPPVVGPMHGMRYQINSHVRYVSCIDPVAIRAGNVSQQPGVLGGWCGICPIQ